MNEILDGQTNLFDLDIWSGKTSPAHSAATKGRTSAPSSKKSAGSRTVTPMFLDLRKSGQPLAASWETDGLSLGEYTTRSFGESPSVAAVSRLSQILEDNPHPKYLLSATACAGILRRAEKRGKELPEILKDALIRQSQGALQDDMTEAHA